VGFEEETDRDYWRALRQLLSLDADQISVVYATPHRWTEFYNQSLDRRVIQLDRRWWDYKHQVLETRHVPPWRVFLWVKIIEACVQLRPAAIWRMAAHPDRRLRAAMRWYGGLGRSVWPAEIRNFWFREKRIRNGPRVAEFWGNPQHHEAQAMAVAIKDIQTPSPLFAARE
jgi:anaerobic magnesium-protoporphyrin IX monomethyl ester cyclase